MAEYTTLAQIFLGSGIFVTLLRVAQLMGRYGERFDGLMERHEVLDGMVHNMHERVVRVEENVSFIRRAVGTNGGKLT